jgi:hypothetical protein
MYLPKDKPDVFALFVDWLYRGPPPTGNSQSYLNNLYHLWIFAKQIWDTKLADATMDQIQDTCKEYNEYEPLPMPHQTILLLLTSKFSRSGTSQIIRQPP